MFNKFAKDQRGNFAAMFAIVSIPMIGAVAMAIEYSNLSRYQLQLQNAVDAAALYAGKYYAKNGELPTNVDARVLADVNFDGTIETVLFKKVGKEIVTSAEISAPGFFFHELMPSVFDLKAEAKVPVGLNVKVEIALVLDTTRSMAADGKLAALKVVAEDFIDTMIKPTPNNNSVKIAVVPFSNHVNVGLSYRYAPWIDVPADITDSQLITYHDWPANTQMTCSPQTTTSDGIPYTTQVCVPTDPSVTMIEKQEMKTTVNKWFGCVGSRMNPYMTTDGAYATRMPGVIDDNDWHCPSPLTPLTDKISTLKEAIDALIDRGDTYMAPGVMWGLRVLSPETPFTEGANPATLPAGTSLRKVMIVMTDGDNTKSAFQPVMAANWGSDAVDANAVTKKACETARDSGVTIYTIAFGTSISADGKSVMQACAGDNARYFPASDAAGLKDAFDSIGEAILSLRLSG